MTIHAHTENTPAPAYVNLSATGPCTVKLIVRSRGENNGSAIDLTNEQLHDFVQSAIIHLNKAKVAA